MDTQDGFQQDVTPQYQSYPADTKTATGLVGDTATSVTTTTFSDKILITVSQEGKIGQWFQVALQPRDPSVFAGMSQPDATSFDNEDDDGMDASLLPMPHLGARTLLGASTAERETAGQLYATQIASSIMAKRPDETRVLLVGLGLSTGGEVDRERFFGLLELVMGTI